MGDKSDSGISRREFARRAAFVSAAASLAPANLLTSDSIAAPLTAQQPDNTSKLSPESQIEVDSETGKYTQESLRSGPNAWRRTFLSLCKRTRETHRSKEALACRSDAGLSRPQPKIRTAL